MEEEFISAEHLRMLQKAQAACIPPQANLKFVFDHLIEAYGLGEFDEVNLATGLIIRKENQ